MASVHVIPQRPLPTSVDRSPNDVHTVFHRMCMQTTRGAESSTSVDKRVEITSVSFVDRLVHRCCEQLCARCMSLAVRPPFARRSLVRDVRDMRRRGAFPGLTALCGRPTMECPVLRVHAPVCAHFPVFPSTQEWRSDDSISAQKR